MRVWSAVFAVLVIWAALIAANARWVALDTRPPFPGGDPARHTAESVQIYRVLDHRDAGVLHRVAKLHTMYPPLAAFASAPAYALLGIPETIRAAAWAAWRHNAVFLLILLLSVYGLAAAEAGPATGILAAFLAATYPLIFSQARYFMLDMPAAAMSALSVFLLTRSEGFHRISWAVPFGVSLGLGLLTKQSFGEFLVGPTLLAVALGARDAIRSSAVLRSCRPLGAWLVTGLLVLTVFLITCGWWYAVQFQDSDYLAWIRYITNLSAGPPECQGRFLTFCGATYYFRALNNAISFGYLVLLVVALGALAAARPRSRTLAYVAAWAVGGYLLISLPQSREPRYEMPLLPAVAVLTAVGLRRIMEASVLRSRTIGRLATGAVAAAMLVFGGVQFIAISFGISWLPQGRYERWWGDDRITDPDWFPNVFFQRYAYGDHPVREDWQTDRIFDVVLAHIDARCAGVRWVGVRTQTEYRNYLTQPFAYLAVARAPTVEVDNVQPTQPLTRYAIIVEHVMPSASAERPPGFSPVGTFALPHGSAVVLRNDRPCAGTGGP